MSAAAAVLLALGVAAAWLGAAATLRLSPLGRLHALAFVNVAGGAPIVLAVWLSQGASASAAKATVIWLVLMLAGALSSHVSGRAIHMRGGERL